MRCHRDSMHCAIVLYFLRIGLYGTSMCIGSFAFLVACACVYYYLCLPGGSSECRVRAITSMCAVNVLFRDISKEVSLRWPLLHDCVSPRFPILVLLRTKLCFELTILWKNGPLYPTSHLNDDSRVTRLASTGKLVSCRISMLSSHRSAV